MGESQVTPSTARAIGRRPSRYLAVARLGHLDLDGSSSRTPQLPAARFLSLVPGPWCLVPSSCNNANPNSPSARNNGPGAAPAADALSLLGARSVLVGRGGAFVSTAALLPVDADRALCRSSPSEISGLSKATSSNASMQATARGGQAGCGVIGGPLGCSRPTSSRSSQTPSARPPEPLARCPTATRPAPEARRRNRGPFASPSRPIPKRHTTQRPRSPRHGRTARLNRPTLQRIPSIIRVRAPACKPDGILLPRESYETPPRRNSVRIPLLHKSVGTPPLHELDETPPSRAPGETLPPRGLDETLPLRPRSLDDTLHLQLDETPPRREPLVLAPGDHRPHPRIDLTDRRSLASTPIT